jgi:hypothetical protein
LGSDVFVERERRAAAMFFDLQYTLRQLLLAVPQPPPVRRIATTETPAAGFGCCPACHEFVRVEPWGPSGTALCPSCGRLIRRLDALGSERSLGASDEL